ncbi:MAG: hypothetical protein AVO33_06850 [delta proteobacterium ML8_F1]|nr:MAG: hypothetical protein AVO33_06850 [delta proteobacterium ML8_F1]
MGDLLKNNNLLQILEEGIIVVNRDFVVEYVNPKAKEILGLYYGETATPHDAGVIEPGDIVILGNNRMGCDDGFLEKEDLKCLGIREKDLLPGDAFIAAGSFLDPRTKPFYRVFKTSGSQVVYRLAGKIKGIDLAVEIDEENKAITVDTPLGSYSMKFFYCIGFAVVLSAKTFKPKFHQQRGYSYRGESLKDLLGGRPFHEKKGYRTEVDILGTRLDAFPGHGDIYQWISQAFETGKGIKGRIIEINKIPLLSSIALFEEGAMVRIENIQEIEDVLRFRNQAFDNLIKREDFIRSRLDSDREDPFKRITGNSVAVSKVKHLAYKAATAQTTVLLTGESGTGKSLFASEIHDKSGREGPFIHVNCGAIPDNLFESELFGYVRGSFTGASNQGKTGYFEAAAGGTIFLDEIAEVPIHIQSKLLHVLQEKQFYRIGMPHPSKTDARVIAATNADLEKAVREGKFRKDLYYRINVFPIELPPLRKRKQDLPGLILELSRAISRRYGSVEKQFSGNALEKLLNYDWPGNIRELENVIERAVIISDGAIVYPEHIDISQDQMAYYLKDILEITEKKTILETLEACNYSNKITMRKLGISKSAYYDKLKKYGIDPLKGPE